MDHSQRRPQLPGSTPAPAPNGKSNAYSTTVKPKLSETFVTTNNSLQQDEAMVRSKAAFEKDTHEKQLQKLIMKLPYSVRESVSAVVNLSVTQSEHARNNYDIQATELLHLKNELKQKCHEADQATKSCEIYRERLRNLDDNFESLQDNIKSRQIFATRNKHAMARLAATNRMLIDALDALQMSQEPVSGDNGMVRPPRSPPGMRSASYNNDESPGGGGLEKTLYLDKTLDKPANSSAQYDKLRESLLRVAREHYRSMKNAEVLETKVEELKSKLKHSQLRSRDLQLQLDELRSIQIGAGQYEDLAAAKIAGGGGADNIVKLKTFGKIDERFKDLLNRHAIDPIDGMTQMRRISAHMADSPATLNMGEVCGHIVSKEVLKIFDVEMVCLFLVQPNGGSEVLMHKYTPRSPVPDVIPVTDTRALAVEVLTVGQIARLNTLAKVASFNPAVDGCPGIVAKKILTMPIRNRSHNQVVGTMHFINKSNNAIFSEVDELFAMVFADHVSMSVAACEVFQNVQDKAKILGALLESSTALYSAVPQSDSMAVSKLLNPVDVLNTMESVTRDILKCINVRAFLVSFTEDESVGAGGDSLIFLDTRASLRRTSACQPSLRRMPIRSGIVGHAIRNRSMYQQESDELDSMSNPQVDIDCIGNFMLTVPIMSLDGQVIACVQMVRGESSPRLRVAPAAILTKEDKDGVVEFHQAAAWLIHQLSAPLHYLIGHIGRPASRPISTPSGGISSPIFALSRGRTASPLLGQSSLTDNFLGPGNFKSISFSNLSDASALGLGMHVGGKAGMGGRNWDHRTAMVKGAVVGSESPPHAEQAQTSATSAAASGGGGGGGGGIASLEAKEPVIVVHGVEQAVFDQVNHNLSDANKQVEQLKKDMLSWQANAEELYNTNSRLQTLSETRQQEINELKLNIVKLTESETTATRALQNNMNAKVMVDSIEHAANIKTASLELEHTRRVAELESAHQQSINELEVMRQNATAALQEVNNDLKQQLIVHEAQESKLRDTIVDLEASRDSYDQQCKTLHAELMGEKTAHDLEAAAARNKENELEDQMNQKDSLISIMQEQLVKMAASSLDEAVRMAASANQAQSQAQGPAGTGTDASPRGNQGRPAPAPPATPPPASRGVSRPMSAALALSSGNAAAMAPWVEQYDDSGRMYYYNTETQMTFWADEAAGTGAGPGNSAPTRHGDWLQQHDDNGNEYWLNEISGESVWELPASQATNNAAQPSVTSSSSIVSAGGYTIEL